MPDFDNILNIVQVVLGVGLVIFAHESGHFIAARFCKVRVDVFSLGFGPRLFGFKRGDTLYQVALVPLGGYVRMAGEEAALEGRPAEPDELGAKSVGQRFLIYSGGVIANVIFALVVFPLLFMIGVPFQQTILGDSGPGGPAWHAGIEPGTRVLSVNGNEVYDYAHIPTEVALGSPELVVLEVQLPGAESTATIELVPEYSEGMGVFSIDVHPSHDPDATIAVALDSPAARAGLASGDRLLAIEGAPPGLSLPAQLAFAQRDLAPVTARFLHDGQEVVKTLTAEPREPDERKLLGVAPVENLVLAVRDTQRTRGLDIVADDRLLSVHGQPILRRDDALAALVSSREPFSAVIERNGELVDVQGPALTEAEAVALASDLALGQDVERNRIIVGPGTAAEAAGLRSGDRVLRIGGADITTFANIQEQVGNTNVDTLRVEASRPPPIPSLGGEVEILDPIEVTLAPVAAVSYGFGLRPATYVFSTSSPLEAINIGARASWKFMVEAWRSMKLILLGQVAPKNVGGIITIGKVSSHFAEVGLAKLFFFLCMLSMNLAFLNVLPIPVLDGGHLFFLLIEKIKGSPVSERVLGYSQIVGLVLIVSLMVYVTYNDLMRWVPWFQ